MTGLEEERRLHVDPSVHIARAGPGVLPKKGLAGHLALGSPAMPASALSRSVSP